MKNKLILLALLLCNICFVYGQSFQDVTAAESEDEINDICESLSLGFTGTPEEIGNIIDEIVNTAGLKDPGFELAQCSNINNAIAKMLTDSKGKDVRYIIYDADWLQSFNEDGLNDWSGKFVLAHEIGHHLNGHSLNNGSSNHQFELAADYFAGRALANLKATLAETLAVTEKMSTRATSSHPGRAERAAQAEAGWKSIENKTRTITVKQEDVSEIAREIVAMIEESLSKTTALTQVDYQIAIKRLQKVRGPNYYDGYTEDIRYLEAVALSGLTEPEKAMDSYINYLSIEGLENEERIEQISKLFAKSPSKSNAFFTNPLVVYSLSKAYYKIKEYDRAISLGNQFLSRSEDEVKQLEVVKIIARSEFEKVESDMKELTAEKSINEAKVHIKNSEYTQAVILLDPLANQNNAEAQDLLRTIYQHRKAIDIKEASSESKINELCSITTNDFTSTPKDVSEIIDEILNTAGVTKGGFELAQCSNINNAIAKMLTDAQGNDVRYIIYDAEWLQSFNEDGLNDWTGKFVLAHEIGHHLNGHSLNHGTSSHKSELEADWFAGRSLAKLGASLDETLVVTKMIPMKATSAYPGRVERIIEIKAGWNSVSKN